MKQNSTKIHNQKKRKEGDIIGGIILKVSSKFKRLIQVALDDYFLDTGMTVNNPTETQFFMGWLLYDYCLPGGRSTLAYAKEQELTDEEKSMLVNLENAFVGYFRILQWENAVKVRDLLTGKEYPVCVVNMSKPKGDLIRARLVKNLDNEFFFFGGIEMCNQRDVKMDLGEIGGKL